MSHNGSYSMNCADDLGDLNHLDGLDRNLSEVCKVRAALAFAFRRRIYEERRQHPYFIF